jgi:ferredoxin-type protein NapG
MHKFVDGVVNTNEYEQNVLKKFDEFEGKACTLCADMCPLPNPMSAIAMVPDANGGRKPEIYDGCIGCGVCQEVCPTSVPSIVVKPRMTYDEYYNKS